jgi:hypothetical protein
LQLISITPPESWRQSPQNIFGDRGGAREFQLLFIKTGKEIRAGDLAIIGYMP